MKVAKLTIENFRGIQFAELKFGGHALLVGPNNVGKSTICEALDLVIGPDRLSRLPAIEEYAPATHRALPPRQDPKD